LGGEGRNGSNTQDIVAIPTLAAPHPQPFSPEYRGEGSQNLFVRRNVIPNPPSYLGEDIVIRPLYGREPGTVQEIAEEAIKDWLNGQGYLSSRRKFERALLDKSVSIFDQSWLAHCRTTRRDVHFLSDALPDVSQKQLSLPRQQEITM